MKNIRLAHDKDLKNIEKLLDEAFGPGRYARTAYRYREKHNLISEYSYTVSYTHLRAHET